MKYDPVQCRNLGPVMYRLSNTFAAILIVIFAIIIAGMFVVIRVMDLIERFNKRRRKMKVLLLGVLLVLTVNVAFGFGDNSYSYREAEIQQASIRPEEVNIKAEPITPVDRRQQYVSGQPNRDAAVLTALKREEKKIGALAAINPAGIKPRKTIIIPVDPNVEPIQHETLEYSDPFAEKIDYSKMPSGLAVGVDRKLRLKTKEPFDAKI